MQEDRDRQRGIDDQGGGYVSPDFDDESLNPPAEREVAEHLLAALELLLGDQEVTATVAGGAVQVAMKFDIAAGFHPISGIRIDPALLDPSRAVDVAALLVEATNAAQQQALELAEEAINDAIVPEEEEEPDENTEELVLATEHLAEATRLAREALAETVVIGQASGGAARIVMNAAGEVQMVYLRLDLVRPERAAELERAYIEAYEDAEAQARAYWQEFMQAITSPDEEA